MKQSRQFHDPLFVCDCVSTYHQRHGEDERACGRTKGSAGVLPVGWREYEGGHYCTNCRKLCLDSKGRPVTLEPRDPFARIVG